jgi:glycosyltransferase involved in cell wall biosynthesis
VDLAMNSGQTNALTAGIARATGRHFIIIDCDLQVNPEDLGLLLAKFDATYDMVGGVRTVRRDNPLRVWISRMGNSAMSRVLGVAMRDLGCGMKVVDGDLRPLIEIILPSSVAAVAHSSIRL